jgi:chemotaxis protein CheD
MMAARVPYALPCTLPVLQTLHPGGVACADRGGRLQTLLGSCVAICLRNVQNTVGGMCHIVYCTEPPAAQKGSTSYADPAVRQLFASLRAKGVDPHSCEAFLYGGGCLFDDGIDGSVSVGGRHVEWARQFLNDCGIILLGQSVGGPNYRKLDWRIGADQPDVLVVPMQKGI